MTNRLEIISDGSGYRHSLNGIHVHAGSIIQVNFGCAWITGRYEWSFDTSDPAELVTKAGITLLSDDAEVRWPQSIQPGFI